VRAMDYDKERKGPWIPKTKLGRLVQKGEIRTMHEALASGLPLREAEIVDTLMPGMTDEVLNVNMVQRMTDSGRRVRFSVITVVGNGDGYVGLGQAKSKEVGPAIRRSIDVAKINLIEIKRGCGSWECGCGTAHTLPFEVTGTAGSVRVSFKPAPRGVGLAVGDVAKHVLSKAGVKDAWSFTEGKARTTVNFAKAAFDALRKTAQRRVTESQKTMLKIVEGQTNIASALPVTEGVEQAAQTAAPPATPEDEKMKAVEKALGAKAPK